MRFGCHRFSAEQGSHQSPVAAAQTQDHMIEVLYYPDDSSLAKKGFDAHQNIWYKLLNSDGQMLTTKLQLIF